MSRVWYFEETQLQRLWFGSFWHYSSNLAVTLNFMRTAVTGLCSPRGYVNGNISLINFSSTMVAETFSSTLSNEFVLQNNF